MKNKFKVLDESGDRRYFTIIPNYIVNHSTVYEQAIYLYMKRVAGENGTCWTSALEIGKKLGIARRTVKANQNKLIKRGWLEIVGRRGKTKPTDEYRIVDLWKLNSDFYQKKESTPDEQSKKIVPHDSEIVHLGHLESTPKSQEEEPIKKIYEEDNTPEPSSGELVSQVIKLFETVNPATKSYYNRPPQRKACQSLIDEYGFEEVSKVIAFLPRSNKMSYMPTITTPLQLWERYQTLKDGLVKKKGELSMGNKGIA